MAAGIGCPVALNLERLSPAKTSHKPTCFNSDIMSRSLCSPKGSEFSLMLPWAIRAKQSINRIFRNDG